MNAKTCLSMFCTVITCCILFSWLQKKLLGQKFPAGVRKYQLVSIFAFSYYLCAVSFYISDEVDKICLFLRFSISYIPTMTMEGVLVKVVDSVTRANCLKGYTFLLESTNMVIFALRVNFRRYLFPFPVIE